MARANDAGADVVKVLLEDFTAVLCRRGFRHHNIKIMREKAERDIEHQRLTSGGRDIVDMVMDRACRARPPPLPAEAGMKAVRRAERPGRINELEKSVRRLHEQERLSNGRGCRAITRARRRTEQQLVNELIGLLRAGGEISVPDMEYWRKTFTIKQMKAREGKGIVIDPFQQFAQWLATLS